MGHPTNDASSFESFAERFSGELIGPSDPGYDDSRQGWNAMIDKRPTLIVRPRGTADVISAVNYARETGLPVAVRCGGHSYAGKSVCDDGLLIDLSLMKGVRVDPAGRTARANGGVLWGEFDHETQVFGLATPGGRISTTGIGGFTLGGGYGWLSPKYGLACDNLVAADVVTADGQLVTASEHENEDLLWGLRGASSNFGVVTSFEFRLHSVGPLIVGGMLLYPVHKASGVLRAYRDYVDAGPDELSTAFGLFSALPEEFLPEELRGQTLLGILVIHCGDLAEGERVVRPLKEIGPPSVDMVGPVPYLVLQRLLDQAAPRGWRWYSGGEHLAGLTDAAIDVIVDHAPQGLDPLSQLIVFRHGGAVSRVHDGDTAVGNRDAAWLLHPLASWLKPDDDDRHIGWRNGVMASLEPFRTGGLYLNWTPDEDQGALDSSGNERLIHGYGPETYARLLALKEKYDPTNMFRFNPNIRPAAAAQLASSNCLSEVADEQGGCNFDAHG
jgi:FAD/FMN-containing dehydrogenase